MSARTTTRFGSGPTPSSTWSFTSARRGPTASTRSARSSPRSTWPTTSTSARARKPRTRSSARASRAPTSPPPRWPPSASEVPSLPPLDVRIDKRIPVAAGLGGGSADAAAALRAANRLAGEPLDAGALRAIAATLGSDVPSQVEPGHALVAGTGELVEPIGLPPLAAVLVPQAEGLSTADVYAQLDRMEGWREQLDLEAVRATLDSDSSSWELAFENDLQPAALAMRPELAAVIGAPARRGRPGRAGQRLRPHLLRPVRRPERGRGHRRGDAGRARDEPARALNTRPDLP